MNRKFAILVFEKPSPGTTISELKPIDAYVFESNLDSIAVQIHAALHGAAKHGRPVSVYLQHLF